MMIAQRVAPLRLRLRVDQAQHERVALRDLLEADEFIRAMRLLDAAGAANHGRNAGLLEQPGLGAIRHRTVRLVARQPIARWRRFSACSSREPTPATRNRSPRSARRAAFPAARSPRNPEFPDTDAPPRRPASCALRTGIRSLAARYSLPARHGWSRSARSCRAR